MTEAKPILVKARLPRGFVDRGADEIGAVGAMLDAIRESYELFGFEAVETPLVEYTEALGKFLPDQDRPNAGVFSFQDDDEQWLSLRYDLTAPLARYVAENFDTLPKPYRSLSLGLRVSQREARTRPLPPVHAVRRRHGGRRQPRGGRRDVHDGGRHAGKARHRARRLPVVKINNRKMLDGVLEAIGLGGEDEAGRRLVVLRAIDKLDRLGGDGVRAAARRRAQGRESGDFTRGAESADPTAIETVIAFTASRRGNNAQDASRALAALVAASPRGSEGVEELARHRRHWRKPAATTRAGC